MREHKLKSIFFFGCIAMILISVGAGCASTHKTTTTETVVQAPVNQIQPTPVIVEKSTTTTTSKHNEPRQTGILGGLFHVIGSVIAFPFIVVGRLLQAIF